MQLDRPSFQLWLVKICTVFFITTTICLLGSPAMAEQKKANISYEVFGSGSEHVLVLHDWLGDSSNYDLAKLFFDKEQFTYAFADLKGYGRSKTLGGSFTADEAAADAVSVADALGWKRFHIVGHSMTGMVVQRVALNIPERIKSVVAASPVAASGMTIDAKTWDFFQGVITDGKTAGAALNLLTGKKLSAGWIKYKVARAMGTSTPKSRTKYLNMFVKHDFSAEAKNAQLDTPFLVVLGANDLPFFHPKAIKATFGMWYRNLTIVSIANAGHYSMQETPALYVSTIEEFISKHTDR